MSMGIDPSTRLRIGGMATGIDPDEMVRKMVLAEQMRIDQANQDRQKIEWRQELYRDIIGDIQGFKDKFFDMLSPDYILSENNFATYKATTTDTTNAVQLRGMSGAQEGEYTVNVGALAEHASASSGIINVKQGEEPLYKFHIEASTDKVLHLKDFGDLTALEEKDYNINELVETINMNISKESFKHDVKAVKVDNKTIEIVKTKEKIDSDNKRLSLKVGNHTYDIELDEGEYTLDELASNINKKLAEQGANSSDVKASVNGTKIEFTSSNEQDLTDIKFIDSDGKKIPQTKVPYELDKLTDVNNTLDGIAKKIITDEDNTLTINIVGKQSFDIKLDNNYKSSGDRKADLEHIVHDINSKLKKDKKHSLNSGTSASVNADMLRARISADGNKIEFVSKDNETIRLSGSAMEALGFPPTMDLEMSESDKMSSLIQSGENGQVSFTVKNGEKEITLNYDFDSDKNSEIDGVTYIGAKNKSIDNIMNDIESKTGLKMSYSQLSKEFTIESSSTGSDQKFEINVSSSTDSKIEKDTTEFLTRIFGSNSISEHGSDAQVTITDPSGTTATVNKTKNNFTIDNVNYNINDETTETIKFTVNQDIDESYKKIESIFTEYNKIVEKINTRLNEKVNRDFKPLTAEQKKDMSEDQIKKWEEKAKQGLLRNDNDLRNMLSNFRGTFYSTVEGVNVNFGKYGIGIDTSNDIKDGGKIKIADKEKLKEMLANNPEEVMNLFIKKSDNVSLYSRNLSRADRQVRYKEEGIFQRINDIINDFTGTMRDKNGKKGALIEKAGIKNDTTFAQNILTKQIKDKDKLIKELTTKLYAKEDNYYKMFARLEQAMNKLNSQANWMAQQLGTGM